jgi:hypothetical protein
LLYLFNGCRFVSVLFGISCEGGHLECFAVPGAFQIRCKRRRNCNALALRAGSGRERARFRVYLYEGDARRARKRFAAEVRPERDGFADKLRPGGQSRFSTR